MMLPRSEADTREVVTLWDGRRGYFYHSRLSGSFLFQPIDSDGADDGPPELADADDHEPEGGNDDD